MFIDLLYGCKVYVFFVSEKVSYIGRRSDGQGVYVYHLEDGNKLTGERIHATDPYVSVGVELENNIIVAKSDIFAYNSQYYNKKHLRFRLTLRNRHCINF